MEWRGRGVCWRKRRREVRKVRWAAVSIISGWEVDLIHDLVDVWFDVMLEAVVPKAA